MIQLTPQMRILVAVAPVDFRRGIDGLARLCRVVLQADPFSGVAFVFRNRRATAIKLLVYDGQGFWLAHKRLSKGKFCWWPEGALRRRAWRCLSFSCCCGTGIRTGRRRLRRGVAWARAVDGGLKKGLAFHGGLW